MHISELDYDLPAELIATSPAVPRDASRMMILRRSDESIVDARFADLPNVLQASDVIVLNDTRVIKARMYGILERASGTRREIEVLFANRVNDQTWEVMCKPGKRVRRGDRVVFGEHAATGTFGENCDYGLRILRMEETVNTLELLDRFGHVPLPPYIQRRDNESDRSDYQTMFAQEAGSVAAPTAALHFTPALRDRLIERGIELLTITLHVGIGTFQPVRTEDPREHRLKPEWFRIPGETAGKVNAARKAGRRILAVGTTTTRTLEYATREGSVQSGTGFADLLIYPGYRFQTVDGLLTNFHLPRSSLLMLVSSLARPEFIRRAYARAVEQRYRFYSYGDCMLIL